jgi:tRNA threonylcarbamoyladenosine dehydratase
MPTDSSDFPLSERHTRTIDFFGEAGFDILRKSFVVVVGLGGVGSHAALSLVRSGIGRLRIIDCDCVEASNLNRHALATPDDLGKPKPEVVKRSLRRVLNDIDIDAVSDFVSSENIPRLLSGPPNFVIDAIDGLNTKVGLLRYCVENRIPVVSSMGASSRCDPTSVQVADISETTVCPLAKHVRRRLRRQGVHQGVIAVYATEPARKPLPPDAPHNPIGGGRVRNRQPSLITMPAIFGITAANEVMMRLTRYRDPPMRVEKRNGTG